MRTTRQVLLLCLLTATARADALPPDGVAEPAPPEASPASPAAEDVGQLVDAIEDLAQLAGKIGLDTRSHEASRLARAADVAGVYLELGLLVARANQPSTISTYWSASLGAGNLRAPDREPAGELAVTAGVAITGPTCTLLEVGARASLATRYGPTAAQFGRVCLGAIELEPEKATVDTKVEVFAINAYEAVGVNVRPSVEAASVTDNRRFALAEVGISVEGLRYHWSKRRWSAASPGVSMSQSVLTRSVDDNREWLARVTASAWFGELRYHRDPGQLTDFTVRLLPIAVDTIESGKAISTLSLVPLEIAGLGTHGVYVDAGGGLDLTADEPGDTPDEIAAKPDVAIGSYRLALRLGIPRFHGALISRQRLLPTLDDSIVAETRASATLHVDLRSLFVDAEAYRAHLRLYSGPGDDVDLELETWGIRGEAWIRAGRHLLVGATVEVGRSFVFAEPSSTIGTPPFGHLVLAQIGWRASSTRPFEE